MAMSECDARLLKLKRYLPFLHQTMDYFSTSPEENLKIISLINIISNQGEQLNLKTLERCEIFCRTLYLKYGKKVERKSFIESTFSSNVIKPNAQDNRRDKDSQHQFQTADPSRSSNLQECTLNSIPRTIPKQREDPDYHPNSTTFRKEPVNRASYRLYPITVNYSRPLRTETIYTPAMPLHSGTESVETITNQKEKSHKSYKRVPPDFQLMETGNPKHLRCQFESREGGRSSGANEKPIHSGNKLPVLNHKNLEPALIHDKKQSAVIDPTFQDCEPFDSTHASPRPRSPWNTASCLSVSASKSSQDIPTPDNLHVPVFGQDNSSFPNSDLPNLHIELHELSYESDSSNQVQFSPPFPLESSNRNSNSERNRQQHEPVSEHDLLSDPISSKCSLPNLSTSTQSLLSISHIQSDLPRAVSSPQHSNSSQVSLLPVILTNDDSSHQPPKKTQAPLQPFKVNRTKTEIKREPAKSAPNSKGEFVSPLENLYSGASKSSQTGKGYGLQNYKIPKKVCSVDEPTKDVGVINDETTGVSENSWIQLGKMSEASKADDSFNPLVEIEEILKKKLPSDDVNEVLDCLKSKFKAETEINEPSITVSPSITGEPLLSPSRISPNVNTAVASGDVVLEAVTPCSLQESRDTRTTSLKKGKGRRASEIARLYENLTDFVKGGSELGSRRSRSKSTQPTETHVTSVDDQRVMPTKPKSVKRGRKKEASNDVHMKEPKRIKEDDGTKGKKEEQQQLCGRNLYVCGNNGCNETAETIRDFKDHLYACGLHQNSPLNTCRHCGKKVNSVTCLIKHIGSHSVKNILCELCPYRSYRADHVRNHMKKRHQIDAVKKCLSVPADAQNSFVTFCPQNTVAKNLSANQENVPITNMSVDEQSGSSSTCLIDSNVIC